MLSYTSFNEGGEKRVRTVWRSRQRYKFRQRAAVSIGLVLALGIVGAMFARLGDPAAALQIGFLCRAALVVTVLTAGPWLAVRAWWRQVLRHNRYDWLDGGLH